jgi:uncharacterized protein (TIGR03083 family)
MASLIPKDRTVAALDEVWSSITELLVGLDDEQWSLPSPLPGWDVQDNVAHIVGTEAMLLGIENPDIEIDRDELPHVQNDIGVFNELWVQYLRMRQPNEVLSIFEEYTGARLAALLEMTLDEWDAESFTPAGRDTYGRFMQIRVFDCWLHEQDIRDAVGIPGHEAGLAVEVTLDEMATAMGFVVGKRAGASDGQSVTFELTDDGAVVRTIHVTVDGRAAVVDTIDGAATTVVRLPVGVMTRLCAGRVVPVEHRHRIELSGDRDLGERVLGALNYTV